MNVKGMCIQGNTHYTHTPTYVRTYVRYGFMHVNPHHSCVISVSEFSLQDVLDTKNSAIKDLQYELARVCKVCVLCTYLVVA